MMYRKLSLCQPVVSRGAEPSVCGAPSSTTTTATRCVLNCLRSRLQVGTAIFSAASAAKIATLDHDGAAERTFRLYYADSQTRTDKFSVAGALSGGLAAAAAGSNIQAGMALGVVAGIMTHLSTSSFVGKKEEKK